MIRRLLLAAALMAAAAPATQAQTAEPAKPPKVLQYLTAADIDPNRLLPPPPAQGSELEKAEIAEMHRIIAGRSGSRLQQAQWDDEHEDWSMYAPIMGLAFDMEALPATAQVMQIVTTDASLAATASKTRFGRNRPWMVDPSIPTCDPDDKPGSSYPSGHATLGYSLGMVLAVLAPEKSQDLMERADYYAQSRVVCGSHYPSDTRASQALAAAFVTALLKNPEFETKLEASRTELRAAHLIK